MKLSSCLLVTLRWPQRVLAISKLSTFEFLKNIHPDLSNNQLLHRLKEQNKDLDEILAEYQRQLACEKDLARVLHNLDISYRIIKSKIGDANRCMNWADLVIAIGGDGTFLLASKLITSNAKPIFGINPHPGTSNSFTMPIESADIGRIFEKLRMRDYTLLMRSRIRTIMTGEGLYRPPFHVHEKSRTRGERRIDALMRSTQRKIADALQPRWRILPWLALNEIFMAEFFASRPISLKIQVDNKKTFTTRSSGICVCTGSGSRSWFKTMNMKSAKTVQTLAVMATAKQLDKKETDELLHKYHNNLLFPPESLNMAYVIYEMYRSSSCSKSIPEKQVCHKVKVISKGFDAGIVLDGSVSLPFNDGSTATFEIRPEYSLKNIILS